MLKVEKTGKSQIKSQNKVRVFREILRQGGISRTQLEKCLSLSAPSVTRVVEELRRIGLIYEEGKEATQVGRRPILLRVKKDAYYSVGINMTRSNLYFCISNLGNEVVYESRADIREKRDSRSLLEAVDKSLGQALLGSGIGKDRLIAIGVASRGIVNREKGWVIRFPAEGEVVSLCRHLEQSFDCHILVENNVSADLKWEYLGGGSLKKDLVYLYVDEGVGGSIICNGQEVDGAADQSARFAHMLVESQGTLCTCGKRGHLEAYVSKPAIESAYHERRDRYLPCISFSEICSRANDGEEMAAAVLENALDKLAVAVVQLITILNPGTVVLYGDLFECWNGVVEKLKSHVRDMSYTRENLDIRWLVRAKSGVRIERSMAGLAVESALALENPDGGR